MKRILLSLGLLSAFAVQASAVLNLTITQPLNEQFNIDVNGSRTASLYGTVTGVVTDVTGYTFTTAPFTFPAAGNTPSTNNGFTFAPSTAFTTYIAGTGNADFGTGSTTPTGTPGALLGTITLTPGATLGSTYVNILSVYDNAAAQSDGENLSVTVVQSTPEPASFAALGVGAIALLRRRRKA